MRCGRLLCARALRRHRQSAAVIALTLACVAWFKSSISATNALRIPPEPAPVVSQPWGDFAAMESALARREATTVAVAVSAAATPIVSSLLASSSTVAAMPPTLSLSPALSPPPPPPLKATPSSSPPTVPVSASRSAAATAAVPSATPASTPSASTVAVAPSSTRTVAPVSHTSAAAVVPPRGPTAADSSGPSAHARALRNDPVARQRYWYACLASATLPACRPHASAAWPNASAPALSLPAWREHVDALLNATDRFRRVPVSEYAGYGGPWIENHFIAHFLGKQEAINPESRPPRVVTTASASGAGSLEAFYPLVPIFVQWTDGAFGRDTTTHGPQKELLQSRLGGLLRNDVLYIALSQHDRGEPASGIPCSHYGNVFVLSGGGWGSAAIPLIKGFAEPLDSNAPTAVVVGDAAASALVPRRASLVFSFVGTVWLGRDAMIAGFKSSPLPPGLFHAASTPAWREEARKTVFSLAPRGYGRSSFRLFEMLQAGRVVVYLYDDVPWLPYASTRALTGEGADATDFTDGGAPLGGTSSGGGSSNGGQHQIGLYSLDTPLTDAQVATAAAAAASSSYNASSDGTHDFSLGWLPRGAMWSPGGVGFALKYSEIPSFTCIACEFILPGSAARWRHVRFLRLSRYDPVAGGAASSAAAGVPSCPCTRARWGAIIAGREHGGHAGSFSLPPDSLVAEMERRVRTLIPSHFTYEAVMKQVERFVASPLEGDLVCVPKPASYGVPDPPWINRRRRRRRQ